MLAAISSLDWALVLIYGLAVLLIAWWAKRRQRSSEDYLMGGRHMPWWLIGVSLIATAFSSISLLGWTGKSYAGGLRWFQLQAGELAAILVVCVLFLPFFSKLRLTTAYEYLEVRFGPRARLFASLLFHIQVLARAGLFLFLTARALAVFTDLDVELCIVLVGLVALLYSCLGGLGAVVWTDALQMLLVLTGVTASVVLVLGELPGGLGDVIDLARSPQRPPALDFQPGLDAFPTFWSSLLAYGVLALSVAGTNQQAVQRYMACGNLGAARRAALFSWALGALVVLLTMGLGLALYAHYQGAPIPPDDVFTTFVRDGLPVGLAGVMVAAIFAASMSSIDSAIHAMATATLIDFVERGGSAKRSESHRLGLARLLTVIYGLLAIAAAFYAMAQGRDVIDLLLRWFGFLAGPVLGIFLLGMLTRRAGELHALVGVAVGYALVVLGFVLPLKDGAPLAHALGIHGIWAASVGAGTTILVALLGAWLGPAHAPAEAARAD